METCMLALMKQQLGRSSDALAVTPDKLPHVIERVHAGALQYAQLAATNVLAYMNYWKLPMRTTSALAHGMGYTKFNIQHLYRLKSEPARYPVYSMKFYVMLCHFFGFELSYLLSDSFDPSLYPPRSFTNV